jgi:hypothetical protein
MSWKKTQDAQPNADAEQVAEVRQTIPKKRFRTRSRF